MAVEKLYPPVIEGTIPAFYFDSEKGTTNLVVPFSFNKAVSKRQVKGFALKIKTVQGSTLLGTVTQTDTDYFDLDSKMQVTFDMNQLSSGNSAATTFHVGQYYKVQLAFIGSDGSTVGYYSTVGVTKFTTKPHIEISGLSLGAINNHSYEYVGYYSQEGGDVTEKMYSCRFQVFDADDHLIANGDSGDILHKTFNDTENFESHETFTLARDLDTNVSYYIQFSVVTSNLAEFTTGRYRIMQKKSVEPELNATLSAKLNFDDGYVDLYLIGNKNSEGVEEPAVGSFVVCRAASNESYVWNKVCEFALQSQLPTRWLWRDYTIEQGVTYKYSIQQYNQNHLYSERILSNSVYADFEDAFLYDGERQLKIRYNPKVSSFKTDVLEQKLDTIGGKHPFIFRNGNVYYHEFPISGLISYQMDDNELFMAKQDLGISKFTTNFTGENITAERLFKMEVLEWLNNGETKLFRSPTEGNYIVRLMNNSLSPTDSLGRMLHTFSCTAYEVADYNYENLSDKGFIKIADPSTVQTRWATVELAGHNVELDMLLDSIRRYQLAEIPVHFSESQYHRVMNSIDLKYNDSNKAALQKYFTYNSEDKTYRLLFIDNEEDMQRFERLVGQVTYVSGRINTREAYSVRMSDMLPGTRIQLVTHTAGAADETEVIQIGATGSYYAELSYPITAIIVPDQNASELLAGQYPQGSITYSYRSAAQNVFDTISQVEIIDVPCRQWIGQPQKVYYDREKEQDVVATDLIKVIEDDKITIIDFYTIKFAVRPLKNLFVPPEREVKDLIFYDDMDCTSPVSIDSFDPYYVYAICNPREDYTYQDLPFEQYYIDSNFRQGYYIDKDGKEHPVFTGTLLDGRSTKDKLLTYDKDTYHTTVTINEEVIDLKELERFTLKNFDEKITSLTFDNGIVCEASYQVRNLTYNLEEDNDEVKSLKDVYEEYIHLWKQLMEAADDFTAAQMSTEPVAYYEANLGRFTLIRPTSNIGSAETKTFTEYEEWLQSSITESYYRYMRKLTIAIEEYKEANATV